MPDEMGGLRVSWQQRLAARIMGEAGGSLRYDSCSCANPALDDSHAIAPGQPEFAAMRVRASPVEELPVGSSLDHRNKKGNGSQNGSSKCSRA